MPGYKKEPSPSATRRVQREKQRAALYWIVGAVLLVAAVAGLLVAMSLKHPR